MVKKKLESRLCIWLKLDAGNIISQQSIRIEEEDNVGTMHDKLSF